jgi:hypothetical protein
MPRKGSPANFILCLDNDGYLASLEAGKIYRVIPDASARAKGYVRVIDESGEDYLYAAHRFVAIRLPAAAKRALAEAR